jgi:uncharacterized protein YjbI with pentapeptide repeats
VGCRGAASRKSGTPTTGSTTVVS